MKLKNLKIISVIAVLSVFIGINTVFAEGVYMEGEKLYIDVSQVQNYTVPLTLKVTQDNNAIYYNAISPDEYKKYAVIDLPALHDGNIKVYMGGALEANGIIPSAKTGIKTGDYISFGKYNGTDMLWICCGADENGILFLSDICLKQGKFSSEESKGEYSLNLWTNSELKDSLNDLAEQAFSDNEQKLISQTYQMQSVNVNDMRLIDTIGTKLDFNRYSAELQNSQLYSYYSYDKLFVPDIIQVQNIASRLSDENLIGKLHDGQACPWWLRTPVEYKEYDDFVYVIDKSACVDIEPANNDNIGIRPAFYLDMDYDTVSGNGTKEDPYKLYYSGEKRKIKITEDRFKNLLYVDIRHRADDEFMFIVANYDDSGKFVKADVVRTDDEYSSVQWEIPQQGYSKFFLWDETALIPMTDAVKVINNY